MASFTYEAFDAGGKRKKANIEAENIDKAKAQLKTQGLTATKISESSALNKDIKIGVKKKVSPRDLGVFCRQFVSISKAGVPLVNALGMLADQTSNKALQESIRNIRDYVEKGDNLSTSMRRESMVFPPLLINMVEAGESSGNLENSMFRMAEHFEKDAKLKGVIKKAMMYPAVLIVVLIAVIIVLLVVVIPNFQSMFDQIGGELPAITKAIVAASKFVQTKWYILIGVIAAVIVAFKVYYGTSAGKHQVSAFLLKMPVFGDLIQKQSCARFAATLSTLISSGMGMVESIQITGRTMDNILYEEAILDAADKVQLGQPLSAPLRASGLFPPMIMHMLGIGEETGNMEEMLTNAGTYYDEEVEAVTGQLTTLMEPVILIVMAGVVCLLIAAIYGPMMTLYNQLGAQI